MSIHSAQRPIAVYHEHPDWFRPLFAELERRGVASICQAAAQAFAANVPSQAAVPFSGKVYVFSVGPGHYYVVDPDYRASPNFAFEFLFTSSWAVVRRVGH